jgi:hypothetical protein
VLGAASRPCPVRSCPDDGGRVSLSAMWDTLGLWLGPTLAVAVASVGTKWFGWFQPRMRRKVALQRIAEKLAQDSCSGYSHQYERWLEHYQGGRRWDEEWELANIITGSGTNVTVRDIREPAPNWRKRLARRVMS